MRTRDIFLFALLLASVRAEDSFFLAPHLSDGMVLQNKESTAFYGLASPGEKVRIEINGRSAGRPVTANKDGQWSKAVRFAEASSEALEIAFYLGEVKVPIRTLRDVIVGEVWLVGIASGDGISARGHAPNTALRFATIQNLENMRQKAVPWRVADREGLAEGYFDLLAFEYASAIAAANGITVGVLHVPVQDLTGAVRERPGSAPSASAPLDQIEASVRHSTRAAITARSGRLLANKREGKVISEPEINHYRKHRVYSRSQLLPKSAFSPFSFKGAIGPELPIEDRK